MDFGVNKSSYGGRQLSYRVEERVANELRRGWEGVGGRREKGGTRREERGGRNEEGGARREERGGRNEEGGTRREEGAGGLRSHLLLLPCNNLNQYHLVKGNANTDTSWGSSNQNHGGNLGCTTLVTRDRADHHPNPPEFHIIFERRHHMDHIAYTCELHRVSHKPIKHNCEFL